MKIVPKKLIPRVCAAKLRGMGVIAEHDFTVTRGSRLFAKVLIFDTAENLRAGWNKLARHAHKGYESIHEKAEGVVNDFGKRVIDFGDGGEVERRIVDVRYFAVIAMAQPSLGTEIVAHEAVHAAFCYDERMGKRSPFIDPENGEECLAYPVGIITKRINNWLHDEGLYPCKA